MHFPLALPLLLSFLMPVAARECAVCPPTICEPRGEEYQLVYPEYSTNTVVCAYFLPPVPPARMKRNGWKYCTYDSETGKIEDTNLDYCLPQVPTEASPECS